MLYAYIAAAVVAGLLIGAATLVIVWMSGRVTRGIRNRTVELISTYDVLLEEKSEKLARTGTQDQEVQTEEQKPVAVQNRSVDDISAGGVLKSAEKIGKDRYRDSSLAESYALIRSSFDFDPSKIIVELGAAREPGLATRLLEQLPYETIYRISMLSREEQYDILAETLTGDALRLLNDYSAKKKSFSVIEFYDYLKSMSDAEPSNARLWISPYCERWDYPGNVEVIVDENICEGFQLECDNVLYDYSVTKREIS